MSPQNPRVSDGDKRRAREAVDQALAAGRIIQADRDMRMSQIDNAQSVDELRMLTHDLGSVMFGGAIPSASPVEPVPPAPTPVAPLPPPPPPNIPPPAGFQPTYQNVPYGSPQAMADEALEGLKAAAGTTAKSAGRSCLGCLIPLVILIVVLVVPAVFFVHDIKSAWDDVKDSFDTATDNPGGPGSGSSQAPPDVLSAKGWNDLKAGVKAATGGTEAFSVVLYPTYASVTAPVDATSDRAEMLYWDGSFDGPGTKTTSTQKRFDMAAIRGESIVRLVAKAKKLVEDPTTWYVVMQAPDFEGSSILAFASNDFNETGYIAADANGAVIRKNRP